MECEKKGAVGVGNLEKKEEKGGGGEYLPLELHETSGLGSNFTYINRYVPYQNTISSSTNGPFVWTYIYQYISIYWVLTK